MASSEKDKDPKKIRAHIKKIEDNQSPIKELAECILDSFREEVDQEIEPFEAYANDLRLRLLANGEKTEVRMTKGYQTLLDVLKVKRLK